MKNKRIFSLLVFMVSITSCNLLKQSGSGSTADSSDHTSGTTDPSSIVEGMNYDGSVTIVSNAGFKATGLQKNASSTFSVVQISSPIGPSVGVLYNFENANFPKTLNDEIAVADKASYPYPKLLDLCVTNYPQDYSKITADKDGVELTNDQLLTNFSEVARCSYEKYMSKPYWIPQLVNDVDICGRQLGVDWRLITEDDVNQLTQDDLQFLNDTLSGAGGNFWASFYINMKMYIRGKDGVLKLADLSDPASGAVVSELPIKPDQWKTHLEGGRTLRCIKVTGL